LRNALGHLEIKSSEAEQQRAIAVANHQEAEKQRQKATVEEQRAKRFLYASEMVLANTAIKENKIAEALRILEELRPEKLGADLRGPEWYHLWTRASGYKELLRMPGGA